MIYLKFPHLDLLWTHMAELVECFNRHCFTIMFVNTLNYDDLISAKICMKYKNFNFNNSSITYSQFYVVEKIAKCLKLYATLLCLDSQSQRVSKSNSDMPKVIF